MEYLTDTWKKEFDEYCVELKSSGKNKALYRALEEFDNSLLVAKLLRLYLERCQWKQGLAFF